MEEHEHLNNEQQSDNQQNSIKNEHGKVIQGLSKFGKFIGNGISKIESVAESAIDKYQTQQKWNAQFEKEAKQYTVFPLNFENDNEYLKHTKLIKAIKLPNTQCLLVLSSIKLEVGQVLCGKQNQSFQIYDFEDTPTLYPSKTDNYPIKCTSYYYKPYVKPVAHFTQNITNTQNITVGDNNSGDISIVADFGNQLCEIENAINSYRPSIINKHKKDEAIKLYGNFKNCVINKQKDQTLFEKFIKILEIVAPTVVSIATTIISAI